MPENQIQKTIKLLQVATGDEGLANALKLVFDKAGGSVMIHKDYDKRIRIIEEIKPIHKILYKK